VTSLTPLQQVPGEGDRERRRCERARPRGGVSLAAGQLEVGVEVAPLRLAAVAEQDETVRVEEPAQVAVREQALVTRIPRALEAVARDGLERVERRDLVDDEHVPARPGDA